MPVVTTAQLTPDHQIVQNYVENGHRRLVGLSKRLTKLHGAGTVLATGGAVKNLLEAGPVTELFTRYQHIGPLQAVGHALIARPQLAAAAVMTGFALKFAHELGKSNKGLKRAKKLADAISRQDAASAPPAPLRLA